MTTQRDLEIFQGSEFQYTLDVTIEGITVPITGWTARMQIRGARITGADVLATLDSTNPAPNYILVSGALAQLLIDVPGSVTATWTWSYPVEYDLFIYEATGEPHVLQWGKIRIRRTVTDPT